VQSGGGAGAQCPRWLVTVQFTCQVSWCTGVDGSERESVLAARFSCLSKSSFFYQALHFYYFMQCANVNKELWRWCHAVHCLWCLQFGFCRVRAVPEKTAPLAGTAIVLFRVVASSKLCLSWGCGGKKTCNLQEVWYYLRANLISGITGGLLNGNQNTNPSRETACIWWRFRVSCTNQD